MLEHKNKKQKRDQGTANRKKLEPGTRNRDKDYLNTRAVERRLKQINGRADNETQVTQGRDRDLIRQDFKIKREARDVAEAQFFRDRTQTSQTKTNTKTTGSSGM